MAHGVAQAASGALTIGSSEGRGTTVSIFLPLTGQDARSTEESEPSVAVTPEPAVARSIPLVDDDEVVRSTIEDMLVATDHLRQRLLRQCRNRCRHRRPRANPCQTR